MHNTALFPSTYRPGNDEGLLFDASEPDFVGFEVLKNFSEVRRGRKAKISTEAIEVLHLVDEPGYEVLVYGLRTA